VTWIADTPRPTLGPRESAAGRGVPVRTWVQCAGCRATLFGAELERNLQVCPRCAHHAGIGARARLASLLGGPIHELGADVAPRDALRFHDQCSYAERLAAARSASAETDALVAQTGRLRGIRVAVACFEYAFMGGSMGSVVGERFALAVEAACAGHMPFICIAASGGARMQEGLYSLMQMGKTTLAVSALRRAGLPFISVLTHPTMGGVSASFAFLADVVIAEPGALIGFAGPRVIEQTVRATLPPGFQRAEFLQSKGAVDLIVDRRQQSEMLHRLLSVLHRPTAASAGRRRCTDGGRKAHPAPAGCDAGSCP
jgi:acetyl-CoA carboxylase carboxyl transferase subunit beta